MSSPHQRTILVKRVSEKVQKDYFKISNKNLQKAMYNLKTNSFKLFCYLCDNSNGYTFDLYSCDFQRIAHVIEDTYLKAFNDLVDKGYLVEHPSKKNTYIFLEESNKELPSPPKWDAIKSLNEDEFELEKKSISSKQEE